MAADYSVSKKTFQIDEDLEQEPGTPLSIAHCDCARIECKVMMLPHSFIVWEDF